LTTDLVKIVGSNLRPADYERLVQWVLASDL
jgi:hypothetical protein